MANKTFCDRCGKEIVQKGPLESLFDLSFKCDAKVWNDMMHGWQSIELCDECNGKFKDWLKNEEKECKCDKNVLEVLDQLEKAEKTICILDDENNHLKQENEFLKSSAVEKLLKKCHIKVEFDVDD